MAENPHKPHNPQVEYIKLTLTCLWPSRQCCLNKASSLKKKTKKKPSSTRLEKVSYETKSQDFWSNILWADDPKVETFCHNAQHHIWHKKHINTDGLLLIVEDNRGSMWYRGRIMTIEVITCGLSWACTPTCPGRVLPAFTQWTLAIDPWAIMLVKNFISQMWGYSTAHPQESASSRSSKSSIKRCGRISRQLRTFTLKLKPHCKNEWAEIPPQ